MTGTGRDGGSFAYFSFLGFFKRISILFFLATE